MKKYLLISLLLVSPLLQAEIYKWVDDQGVVHYGDKSVENSESLEVNTQDSGNIEKDDSGETRAERRQKLIDAIDEDNARKKEEKAKKKAKKQKHDRRCVVAKDNLKRIERAGYLYDLDKDGNRVIVDDAVRQKSTQEYRQKIKKYCK